MGLLSDAIKSGGGAGARAAKLYEAGEKLVGVVESTAMRQARDDNDKPAEWDDGNPKQQVVIVIQTDLDEGEDDKGRPDDGRRAVYIKWWGLQRRAFLDACAEAGVDDVLPGFEFGVKYLGVGEKAPGSPKLHKPPNLFRYKITPKTGLSRAVAAAVVADDHEEVAEEKPARPAARKTVQKKAAVVVEDDDDDF